MKLKFIKKLLESQFLEQRIQGIKDLNQMINDLLGQEDKETEELL